MREGKAFIQEWKSYVYELNKISWAVAAITVLMGIVTAAIFVWKNDYLNLNNKLIMTTLAHTLT